jgi:putative nucleotidyltransferase with HDIG domain
MKVEFTLLRTRVARRMLVLFLLCALVPIVTLAGITYPIVVARLEADRMAQLHADGKEAGMLILARLEKLAGRLQWAAPAEVSADSAADDSPFAGIVTEQADGRVTVERGQVGQLPALTSAAAARLAGGKPILVVSRSGGAPGVYLAMRSLERTGAYSRRWGYLAAGSVITGFDLVPDGINLCVEDRQGPLACTAARDPSAHSAARLTARWPIFLKSEFGAPGWAITLTQRRSDALAPLAEFRRSFLLGLIFAIVLVFVLSHVQIRRRMTPLADLEAGTRRLRNGDFSSRVVVESNDEFQSLGAAFNRMATDLERQFTTLSALHQIDHAALRDHSAGAVATAALHGAPALLQADVVALATAGPAGATGWRLDVVTPQKPVARLADVELSARDIADLETAGDYVVIADDGMQPGYCQALGIPGCREWIIFPIHGQRGPIGVLIVGGRGVSSPEDMLTTGRQLAAQLALGLSNVSLVEELDSLSLGALTALARTIDAASHWTAGHSERVTQHAVAIAEALNVDPADVARLRHGGLLHDIGKIGVPAAILDKPGPLSEAELAVMQSHPAIGARIVESVRAFRDLVPLVLHHHELLDGTGYPDGLRGDEIPDLVRILTVADVFDALTSDRPYRKGLTADAALAILTKGIATKFDPRAVAALCGLVTAGSTAAAAISRAGTATLSARDEHMLLGVEAEQAA